jgi:deoxyadenosine/deoxycytidine kinase
MQEKFFLSVEGNIGAGKSTFLNKVRDSLDCSLLWEPCHEWQDIGGLNLLDEFYKDIKRWAYSFQLYAFLTRIEAIEKKLNDQRDSGDFFIAERSIFADRYVFAQVCYEIGNMSQLEWNMYCKWFDWTLMRKAKRVLPSGLIYLKVDPLVSCERIKYRGRSEEKDIPFDYLQSLDNYHDEWLIQKKGLHTQIKDIPVLVLDCNEEFENNEKVWNNMLDKLIKFIKINYNNVSLPGEYYGNSTSYKYGYK